MAAWSQSHFLQSLGWATLNSFWQMALLWCLFLAGNHLLKFSAHRKYQLSVVAMLTGFVWFTITFFLFYSNSFNSSYSLFDNHSLSQANNILNACLISASIAYLVLLIFPAYRLFRNWKYVQVIKKVGLHKADLEHRLFTQKISALLGIGKKVKVYVSEIVFSPVTVGYLKPIILLPVAALNHLSVPQVEAILLHELSHIKRYDYLVNLVVSIIHTLLYFNPFVKMFMRQIEAERENCCDQLVLQFGYDKVSYASALLTLEKTSGRHRILALGATGKKNLLTRIENIVGMEKKKGLSFRQFIPVLAALICITAFNSVLIISDAKKTDMSIASNSMVNPFNIIDNTRPVNNSSPVDRPLFLEQQAYPQTFVAKEEPTIIIDLFQNVQPVLEPSTIEAPKEFTQVNFDEVDGTMTHEQKQQVKTTVDATKKVLSTLQWEEVEKSMADALTKEEKVMARKEYMTELDNVNWNNIEKNLKVNYDKIDWQHVNTNLNVALTQIQLDSIQKCYTQILSHLSKAEAEITSKAKSCVNPLPDQSLEEVALAKEMVKKNLEEVKAVRNKKVIRL